MTLTPAGEKLIPKIREIYKHLAEEAVGDYRDLDFLREHLGEIAARLGRPPVR